MHPGEDQAVDDATECANPSTTPPPTAMSDETDPGMVYPGIPLVYPWYLLILVDRAVS
jgi:hypothetical protein